MKLIILAAGEGTRLKPLTSETPKPLIKIFGKTIIEHNLLNILSDENKNLFDEIIFIVKYKKEKIKNYFGDIFNGINITYHIQGEKKGTAGALFDLNIDDDVLIINGDSIFDKEDINSILKYNGYGVLVKEVENPSKYGIFEINDNGFVKKIIEKPKEFVGNLANLGIYKLNNKIFQYIKDVGLSSRGEYEITDSLNEFAKNFPLKTIKAIGKFIDVGQPWDIFVANNYFFENLKESIINGKIEDNVIIKGKIILEEGAYIKSGTYIEGNCYIGKNSIIGPNIFIRGNVVIGNNCKLGANNEIKNTIIGDNTNIAHLSYFGDSILGNNINIGGGFISANLRNDGENVKFFVKGKLLDTGLRKFGIVIGDNVKTGIKAYSMPGRQIEANTTIMPGEKI